MGSRRRWRYMAMSYVLDVMFHDFNAWVTVRDVFSA